MKSSNNILKAFALLFTVILFIGLISMPIRPIAASAVQLTVSDASGKAGDEVKVSINITSNSELGAADIKLVYDTSKLVYKSHKQGEAAVGSMTAVNPDYKTEGNFKTIFDAFVNADGLDAGGSLLDITFTIKAGWSGTTPLVLTTGDFVDPINYKKIAHTVKNGTITIDTAATTTQGSTQPGETTTTKPGETTTTKPGGTTTTKPTTTRTEVVTGADGSKVTETDKAGSTVYKTTVVYETVTRTEVVTGEGGSKVFVTDEAGSTVYKTTVIYERVVGTEYVTDEDGEKITETDEAGSTVYKTTVIYETVDGADLQDESTGEKTSDDEVGGSLSTAKKAAIIIAFVLILLVVAALVAYKRKKNPTE